MRIQRVSGGLYRGTDVQTGKAIAANVGDTLEVSEPMAQYLQRVFAGDWVPAECQAPPTAEPIQDRMVGVPIKRRPGRPRKVRPEDATSIG